MKIPDNTPANTEDPEPADAGDVKIEHFSD
jgi:hypothetical protein